LCVSVIANNVNWGVSGIEGDTDLNDLQDTVKKKFGAFAPDLPNLDQLNESIPALDEGERVLKEKCLKNSQSNNSYEMTVVSHLFLLFFTVNAVNVTLILNTLKYLPSYWKCRSKLIEF